MKVFAVTEAKLGHPIKERGREKDPRKKEGERGRKQRGL